MKLRAWLDPDPPRESLAWAAACVGARARVEAWMRLPGGSACAIHALDVKDARGRRHALVLKRFVQGEWVAREPDVAAREARHLEALASVDLPIPRPVGVDAAGERGDSPAILMTRLPGRVELLPRDRDAWLSGLVEVLAALHAQPSERLASFAPYRSYHDVRTATAPAWTRRPEVWERVIERLRGAAPTFATRFVHRDYHPSNLLWTQGRPSGVLDFTDSSRGPAAVDLGHCRLNLAQLHGPECADRFAALYALRAPGLAERDPYWDLRSLVDMLPGPEGVYPGWTRLGVRLTSRQVYERLDAYAEGIVRELG